MKFYVATKFDNRANAKVLSDYLISLGHEVPNKWFDLHLHPKDQQELSQWAIDDIEAAHHCDYLIALLDYNYIYKGAWVEIGAALSNSKKVIALVNSDTESCIFFNHPNVTICHHIRELYIIIMGV